MTPLWPLSLRGIEIVESPYVPYRPGRGWFPIGPNAVAMHPDALADMLRQIGEEDRLMIVRRIKDQSTEA